MEKQSKKHRDTALADSRRKQLLEAAETCFIRHGFHNASMSHISKASGMSMGNIYGYFQNKEDIINALVQSKLVGLDTFLEEHAANATSLEDFLCELVRLQMLARQDQTQEALMFDILAELDRNEVITASMRAHDKHFRSQLVAICRRFRPDWGDNITESRVDLIMLLLDGFPMRTALHPDMNMDDFVRETSCLLTALCKN